MRGAGGVGLIAVGIVLLWLAITGRLECVSQFVSCVFGGNTGAIGSTSSVAPVSNTTGNTGNQWQQIINNIPGIIDFTKGVFSQPPQATPGISTQGQTI